MKYFFCKLIPPRPLVSAWDLNEVEMIAMREHVAHWVKAMDQGKVIAFGPVADLKGFGERGSFRWRAKLSWRSLPRRTLSSSPGWVLTRNLRHAADHDKAWSFRAESVAPRGS